MTDTDPTCDVTTSTAVNSNSFFIVTHDDDDEEPTVGTYVTIQAVTHQLLRSLSWVLYTG
jgi:hypothetical protein